MTRHGIDVCECGAVVARCRCPGPHVKVIVCKRCPKCSVVPPKSNQPRNGDTMTDETTKHHENADGERVRQLITAVLGLGDGSTAQATDTLCDAVVALCARLARAEAERDAWRITGEQESRNRDYYCGLLDTIAEHLGPDVYVANDGSRMDSPLRAKLPAMVADLTGGGSMSMLGCHGSFAGSAGGVAGGGSSAGGRGTRTGRSGRREPPPPPGKMTSADAAAGKNASRNARAMARMSRGCQTFVGPARPAWDPMARISLRISFATSCGSSSRPTWFSSM